MNQKSVFYNDDEYTCTQFFDEDEGIHISLNGKPFNTIQHLVIPEIDDEDGNIDFDNTVIDFIKKQGVSHWGPPYPTL
jgi:hypothetical protein